jgi:hypothetical protein
MYGSRNAQQLQYLVENIGNFAIVSGAPGNFSLSQMHLPTTAAPFAGGVGLLDRPVASLTSGEAALANVAVAKSNAAALATPSAASGQAARAATPISIIGTVAKGLPILASTPANIHAVEAGSTGTLHWWGWSLDMNESAALAFKSLLQHDLAGFTAIAAALAPVSAPLAAASAILTTVATGLAAWITAADTEGNGVTINGYLWIGVDVTGNS